MQTQILDRVLKDINAPAPSGCSSDPFRKLLHDFFSAKPFNSAKKYWWRYRNFAEYLKIERNAWPGAIEALLRMDEQKAKERILAYRHWLKIHKNGFSGKHGSEGPGIFTLVTFARERRIIRWKYPHSGAIRSETAWEKVDPSFKRLAEDFLRSLRHRNFHPRSLSSRRSNLCTFGRWLAQRRIHHLAVDYPVACNWMDWLLGERQWSNAYKRVKLETVKHLYQWLRARRVVPENPFDTIGPIRVEHRLPPILTEKQVLSLITSARDPKERALVEFLYATGCRVGELCDLDLKHVSLESRTAKVLGKFRTERMLLFNRATQRAILAYLPLRRNLIAASGRRGEESLFVNCHGKRLRVYVVQKILKELGSKAGIPLGLRPHLLRHSYATHMFNRGADPYSLMHLMGHKSLMATLRYLRVATDRLAQVYRNCHPRK